MTAWHSDPELKAAAVARMREHAAADRLIRGSYVDIIGGQWRGCLHGCLTAEALAAEQRVPVVGVGSGDGGDWHGKSERLWGIPRDLGALLDRAYESSPRPAGELAVEILEAIPVGADLSCVTSALMWDLLHDPEWGVWRHTDVGSAQRAVVDRVAGLLARRLDGDEPTMDEWDTAADAADAAAAAAWAADAADAADAAAWAAADDGHTRRAAAAWAAAGTAWVAWAAEAAVWQERRLLHHLAHAPVQEVTR